jgi:hypothetical protein
VAKTAPKKQTKKNAAPAAQPQAPAFVRGGRLGLSADEAEPFTDFTNYRDKKRRLFLQALATTPRVGKAAKMAGITPKTAWNWRHDPDPQWQADLQLAERLGLQRAESEMWRRHLDGVEEPVYYQGHLVGTKRVFSDTAGIFMLKGAMPSKYRERVEQHTTVSGSVAHAHLHLHAETPLDELERRMRQFGAVIDVPGVQHEPAVVEARPVAQLPAGPEPATPEQAYQQKLAARKTNGNGSKQ